MLSKRNIYQQNIRNDRFKCYIWIHGSNLLRNSENSKRSKWVKRTMLRKPYYKSARGGIRFCSPSAYSYCLCSARCFLENTRRRDVKLTKQSSQWLDGTWIPHKVSKSLHSTTIQTKCRARQTFWDWIGLDNGLWLGAIARLQPRLPEYVSLSLLVSFLGCTLKFRNADNSGMVTWGRSVSVELKQFPCL